MQKIKDVNIGEMIDTTLVVLSATARETKAKKPFLQLEFFDGTDSIVGMYWDWGGVNIPAKNSVLDVTAQVTEYMGVKQLNVKTLTTNNEIPLSAFAPDSGINIEDVYMEAFSMCCDIKDNFLREVSLASLEALGSRWKTVPGAKGVHHAFLGGTLIHSLSVAKIALAISRNIPESNNDLCFVGGLLHDLGKLYTYTLNGATIDMTPDGQLYEHTFMGAEFIGNFIDNNNLCRSEKDEYKARILRHIILSHHGLLEYGAAVPPMCIEAHIVNHADGVDASVQQIIEQSRKLGNVMFTDRIYTLNNKPQLTVQYVKEVFSGE